MSRLPDPEQEPVPDEPGPAGHLAATRPGVLVGLALLGLVVGWSVRPLSVRSGRPAPAIGWMPVLALVLVAVVLAVAAWATHRALQTRHERMAAHLAVNRLVLAKACALTGSLLAGGYLGSALSWVGLSESPLGEQRLVRSLVAGLAGVGIVAASLLLERACRVTRDGET